MASATILRAMTEPWLNALLVIDGAFRFEQSLEDIAAAHSFVGRVEAPDKESLARAIVMRVHERMRIRPSAFGLGMPKSLRAIVDARGGNCVSHSVLAAVLLRDTGIAARLVSENAYTNVSLLRVLAALVRAPIGPTLNGHVWLEALVEDQWVPADAELGIFGFNEWCARRLAQGTTLASVGIPIREHWKFPLRLRRLGPDGQSYEDAIALYLIDTVSQLLGPTAVLPPAWVEGVHYFSTTFPWDGWAGLRIVSEWRRLRRISDGLAAVALGLSARRHEDRGTLG